MGISSYCSLRTNPEHHVLVSISDLPEITENALTEEMLMAGLSEPGPFYKQYKCIFGFIVQTCYIGAQVSVASFAVNFINEQRLGISKSKAALMFSLCHLIFTVGPCTVTPFLRSLFAHFFLWGSRISQGGT